MRKHLRNGGSKSYPQSTVEYLWNDFKDSSFRLVRRLNNPQDVEASRAVAILLLLLEVVLCLGIIVKVPYTEIDWEAYMEQVDGFLQGERDYKNLKGGTGPLVYPAGFLYIYTGIYKLSSGKVFSAQLLFAGLYLANLTLIFWIYLKAKALPPWALFLLCLSKRIHSIYLLRLFNDGVAMFVAYCATALLIKSQWIASIVVYSLAVSIKMNVLLMAPPVLVVLLKVASLQDIFKGAAAGILVQLLLGLPFILHNATSYFSRAFELSRVFMHVWSVNLKFLPEPLFQSKALAILLLAAHLILLWLFAEYRWCRAEGGLWNMLQNAWLRSTRPSSKTRKVVKMRAEHILTIVFTGNFIGIVCARSLHFQFYSWYFHLLPLLLWECQLHSVVRVGLWGAIELIWNIYPTTPASSLYLTACHLGILLSLWIHPKELEVYGKT